MLRCSINFRGWDDRAAARLHSALAGPQPARWTERFWSSLLSALSSRGETKATEVRASPRPDLAGARGRMSERLQPAPLLARQLHTSVGPSLLSSENDLCLTPRCAGVLLSELTDALSAESGTARVLDHTFRSAPPKPPYSSSRYGDQAGSGLVRASSERRTRSRLREASFRLEALALVLVVRRVGRCRGWGGFGVRGAEARSPLP